MKERLYLNNKIEVKKSLLHGYGVFAKEKIEKDEILEECFYLVQPISNPYNADYLYKWPQKGKAKCLVIALGFGSIYNSSKTLDERNTIWITDENNNIFIFKTIKSIEKDEEILTYYGDNWWKNHNQKYLPENIK
jgi:SET domain-containing protein